LNGLYKSYYENGQLESEGSYIDGKKNGHCTHYHDTGQLESEGNYINGFGLSKDANLKS